MRTLAMLVVGSALVGATGCGGRPDAAPEARSGGWSWHDFKTLNAEAGEVGVAAAWGAWNKKLVFVILTDAAATMTTDVSPAGQRTEFFVKASAPKSLKAELRVETPDGKTGRVRCGDSSYELAQGAVFVLLPRGERFQVQQLPSRVSDLPASLGSVQLLLQDDPEVGRFFAKAE